MKPTLNLDPMSVKRRKISLTKLIWQLKILRYPVNLILKKQNYYENIWQNQLIWLTARFKYFYHKKPAYKPHPEFSSSNFGKVFSKEINTVFP